MSEFDDHSLGCALVALGQAIELPDEDTFVTAVMASLRRSSTVQSQHRTGHSRRRWRVAIGVTAALSALTLAVPDARATVADWFGIGAIRVSRTDDPLPPTTSALSPPASLGDVLAALDLRAATSLTDAATSLGFPERRPTVAGLASPDLVATAEPPRVPQLAQIWLTKNDLAPSAGVPAVSIVLSQLRIDVVGGGFQKLLPPGTRVEQVRIGNLTGWWISGDVHQLSFFQPDGTIVTDASRLAGGTLVWTDGRVTYRLESSLGRERSISFAASLVP